MSPSTPCRFFNTSHGCKRGNQCHFAHNSHPTTPSTSTVLPPDGPPPGVCKFYWEQGTCKREFDCRYAHIHKNDKPKSPFIALAQVAPFLVEQGIAKMDESGADDFFSQDPAGLSPFEAHNTLKRFLSDVFRFNFATSEVYAFLKPLNSATASNSIWTQEDGQLLLQAMASQNGLYRLIDIIRWPQVSTHAGNNPDVLSFQRGIFPVLRYLSSDFVVKSILVTRVNTLFTEVLQNIKELADTIESNMAAIMTSRSFNDPYLPMNPQLGAQVLASIAGVLDECLVRFKNAVALYPRLATLVTNLRIWFDEWSAGIAASPPAFDSFQGIADPVRDVIVDTLREKVKRLETIVNRELGKEIHMVSRGNVLGALSEASNDGLVTALCGNYDPPGTLREDGPRHDNDFVDIYDIRVAPTHQELLCRTRPFLPASLYAAPHPAAADSMQRLLDIQFRLLREELLAPLRKAVQLVEDDLGDLYQRRTELSNILQKRGGKYQWPADSHGSLMFNIYTNVTFVSLVPDRRGISVCITIDAPPGRARNPSSGVRIAFWKGMSRRRFVQGNLVALVWQKDDQVTVHLGTIASSLTDLTTHVQTDGSRIKVRVAFFDNEFELRILSELRGGRSPSSDIKMLVESPVMFEAIRPFLEALKTEPEPIPFSRYLVFHPSDYLRTCAIDPPKYACLPGFNFQLSSLFNREAGVNDLRLFVSDKSSVDRAREELRRASRLDPSQADAVIATLTSEVALIQGAPGTGKSYTGVELLRVLVANNVGPILVIAFTDHALDHMLCSVLDAGITTNIVRLGSRASEERIAKYSIEAREVVAGKSLFRPASTSKYYELQTLGNKISKLINRVREIGFESDSTEINKFLSLVYPGHHVAFISPPSWINVAKDVAQDGDAGGAWQRRGRRGQVVTEDTSLYAFWKNCGDLEFLDTNATPVVEQAPAVHPRPSNRLWMKVDYSDSSEHRSAVDSADEANSQVSPEPVDTRPTYIKDAFGFFTGLGEDGIPTVPLTNRDLDMLLDENDVWRMSRGERQLLHAFWIEEAREQWERNQQDEFEQLRKKYVERVEEHNEIREQVRRELLKKVDIIGYTTTGAAKLGTLLKSLSPKVLMVEEAGQVLEAHVLGNLVPSVEHLILIGDPLQLRPNLNNFSLSVDHSRGGKLYRFDMSLMERLSTSGLPMSRIDVQRRMRPMISSLIRNTLYAGLQDHHLAQSYPDVQGMVKNVFFVTHNHNENDGLDDTASKFNTYEVEMVRDLVLYLLRQGCYSEEGNIVVMCAYLGQLARLRDSLGGKVTVVIDEQDQAALDDYEGDKDDMGEPATIERVKVTGRVKLCTIHDYQGEEGKIVILSLVQNSGGAEDEEQQIISLHNRVNIGLLKSESRTNVALSRAREGLYIFGNAENLSSKSRMWRSIIEELDGQNALGPALPVACQRHREKVEYVSRPGQLSRIALDGGCLEQCDTLLKCGHLCPFKCHYDDPNHVSVICTKPCRRLCHRDHPCRKECHAPCDDCLYPIPNVQLSCGHIKTSVPCYQMDMLENIRCYEDVVKQLPDCEHQARMPCSQDPEDYQCLARCEQLMACCGKNCSAACSRCQKINTNGQRIEHAPHPCQKRLYCEHACQVPCCEGHEHTSRCTVRCRQVCPHAQCRQPCHVPCAPCKMSCTWSCPHYMCPVPCGSVCARLPCDLRCEKILSCGHQCPSVCGEDCFIQVCPQCASEEQRTQIADFVMQRTLAEIDPDSETLDELLITIPSCRHTFTVETLDGHCSMNEFYSCGLDGRWRGLLSPIGFRRPPMCPTCRSEITAPRYGRVFKRANLDILERNVAAQMSASLADAQTRLESVSIAAKKANLIADAETINLEFNDKTDEKQRAKQGRNQKKVLSVIRERPTPYQEILPANTDLFFIDSAMLGPWQKAMFELLNAYKQVAQVAETRSAHTEAWEAALSCLHESEIHAVINAPSTSAGDPMVHAMRVAKMKIGQLRPLTDRRFLVESIWLTLHIRLLLTDLTIAWMEAIDKRLTVTKSNHHLAWAAYTGYLFKSCLRDANVAFVVAKDSESHRQLSKTVLYRMRISLEEFRFDLMMCKMTGRFTDKEHRDTVGARASELRQAADALMKTTIRDHLNKKQSVEEVAWLEANFSSVARDIMVEWDKVEQSLRMDTFYEPVSLQERIAIVKAMGFAHAGHYYNCPNGHTFVITECGTAVSASRCPECDALIGGSDHHLHVTNTRNEEFEALARQHGAGATPWPNPW